MAGTSAEYNWNFGFCSERYTPLDPTTPYGICKHALHQMARSWADENGVELGWGRVFFLYGPHEYPQRLVASVVRALLQGEEAPCSQGAQMRDFLHVADVASAFVATLKSDFTGSFNIASGEPVSVRHVVSSIAQQIGREELVKFGALASPPGDPIMLAADPSRLRHEMGWSPEFTLSSGLAHTIRWWRRELSL
jgi:nucleoside-diphosphate-sugar epimerase